MPLPTTIWIASGSSSTRAMRQGWSNWNRARGSGRIVAMIEPTEGMKLSRKAITPNTSARSRPSIHSTSPTRMPVTADVATLVLR